MYAAVVSNIGVMWSCRARVWFL